MHAPRSNSILPSTATLVGRHAHKALGGALVALAVWAVTPAECRADDAIGVVAPAGTVGCDRHRSSEADARLESGSHEVFPVSIDGGGVAADIPVWKTIGLGVPQGIQVLRAALKASCRVGDLAGEMLDRPAFAPARMRTRVDLVVLSVAELGFEGGGATRAAVYDRAMRLGLQLCPAEVGPQLRLQYPDQPTGEFLHIAMRPIATQREAQAAFVVSNGGGGLLLIGSDARPERIVPPRTRFVFVHPR